MHTIQWPKPFTIFLNFYGGAVFASQITKGGRECAWRTNSLVGQFLHQLFLVQKFKMHSAVADSPMAKLTYFSSVVFLRGDQSLLHRSTNSGKECAWRNNYLVGQFLNQVSLVQRSKSIEKLQTIPWPN